VFYQLFVEFYFGVVAMHQNILEIS